jgi:hypothetical protein
VGKYLGENGIIVLLNICMRKPLVRKNSYIRNNDLRIMYEHPSPKPNRKI